MVVVLVLWPIPLLGKTRFFFSLLPTSLLAVGKWIVQKKKADRNDWLDWLMPAAAPSCITFAEVNMKHLKLTWSIWSTTLNSLQNEVIGSKIVLERCGRVPTPQNTSQGWWLSTWQKSGKKCIMCWYPSWVSGLNKWLDNQNGTFQSVTPHGYGDLPGGTVLSSTLL